MTRKRLRKNLAVGTIALVLATLGVYNIFLKATCSLLDDGVFWKDAPEGVVAARVAALGHRVPRGSPRWATSCWRSTATRCCRAADIEAALAGRQDGDRVSYQLLRANEKTGARGDAAPAAPGQREPVLLPLPGRLLQPGVGTIVMLRRPTDRNTLHFYAICLLFFLLYSTSFTGRLNLARLDVLLDRPPRDPVPARGLPALLPLLPRAAASPRRAAWLVPLAYMPAFVPRRAPRWPARSCS